LFAFNDDVGLLEDLEEGVAEPLGEFMERYQRLKT
jgi:hypothetical protein